VLRQFTVDVSAAGVAGGRPFRRELVFGPFEQTDDVGYGAPGGGSTGGRKADRSLGRRRRR
jgi:hypothetical protein